MAKRDYYEVLGVDRGADARTLKKAYRKLAFEFHPDRNPDDPQAEERFKEASQAFEVLSDDRKRAIYDQYGHAGLEGAHAGPSQTGDINDIFSAFSDIFSGFGFDMGGRSGRSRGPRSPAQGETIQARLQVELEQVDQGAELTIEVERFETCDPCRGEGVAKGSRLQQCSTCGGAGFVALRQGFFTMRQECPDCRGQGQIPEKRCPSCRGELRMRQRREVEVKIPEGLPENARLRLRGEGHHGIHGGPAGDLELFIEVADHEFFERREADLVCEIPISYPQATLGSRVEVPTFRDPAEVNIPAGTPSGKIFRVRGAGLPNHQTGIRGDLLVRVFVEVPTRLLPEEEDLLRQLAELRRQSVKKKAKGLRAKIREIFE